MSEDLAIIGSGAAAFAAAISAARSGRSVVLVERGAVGGTCVNTGCIPSKALLAAAQARHDAAAATRFPGIDAGAGGVDFALLIAGKDDLVARLRAGKYLDLAAEYGIEIVEGDAKFISGPSVMVALNEGGQRRIDADVHLIAAGASPWIPPIRGLDRIGYLTSTTAMELVELPDSLLVIGGNAIGLEQAQMFARLGVAVTVVEARDRIAPFEEPEISAIIEEALVDEGVEVYTGAAVTRVRSEVDGMIAATVAASGGLVRDVAARHVLVATGRVPNTVGLDLDVVGVAVGDRGEVIVDEQLRTGNPRIWAAGDVIGGPQFVYVAAAQGRQVVENAFGDSPQAIDYRALPRVTFASPAIASVGLTEQQARGRGLAVEVGVLPLAYVPRAIVDRDTRGLVKLVAEAGTGRLLGAHVAAEHAGEIIAGAVYALTSNLTVSQLAETWSPYLTMGEALKLAAQTFTQDVTKLSCCAG